MKARIAVVVALLAVAGVACSSKTEPPAGGGTTSSPPATAATEIGVDGLTFKPNVVTIAVGGTLRWSWKGAVPHNVVSVDGLFNSGDPVVEDSQDYTFSTAGTFKFYCSIHGTKEGAGMFGTVTVA